MTRFYKNLVFTKHALERLNDRVLTQDAIYQTVTAPDNSYPNQHGTKFIRTVNGRLIHVIATPIENHQWLIVSTWVRGEEDNQPLLWQLLTLPFKLFWYLLQKLLRKISP